MIQIHSYRMENPVFVGGDGVLNINIIRVVLDPLCFMGKYYNKF